MQEFSSWFHPSCPIEIEYSVQALEAIREKAVEGLVSMPKQGLGIGCLLLGTRRGNGFIRILDFEEIPCSHAAGTGFVLTPQELEALRLRLQQRGQLAVVGLFLSKPRGGLDLVESQRILFERLFPEAYQVALLMRPASLDPSRCVFYFQNMGLLTRGPEWELQPLAATTLMENAAALDRPTMDLPMPERPAAERSGMERTIPERQAFDRTLIDRPPVVNPISVQFAGRKDLSASVPAPPPPAPPAPAPPVAMPPALTPPASPAPVERAAVAPPVAEPAPVTPKPEFAAPAPAVPVKPINVAFDSKAYKPLAPTGVRKFLIELDAAYKSVRLGLSKVLYSVLFVALLGGVVYGVYLSRPLWVTPPPANLTVTDAVGILTFRWNPEAVEFVDSGTISILDNGRRRTIALTHKDLLKGSYDYRRRSGRVTASLALDERRFIAAFNDPNAPAADPTSTQAAPAANTTPAQNAPQPALPQLPTLPTLPTVNDLNDAKPAPAKPSPLPHK